MNPEEAQFRKELEELGLTKVEIGLENLQWTGWRWVKAKEFIREEKAAAERRRELVEAQRHEREIQTAKEANTIADRALTWSKWNTVIAVSAVLIALAALFVD